MSVLKKLTFIKGSNTCGKLLLKHFRDFSLMTINFFQGSRNLRLFEGSKTASGRSKLHTAPYIIMTQVHTLHLSTYGSRWKLTSWLVFLSQRAPEQSKKMPACVFCARCDFTEDGRGEGKWVRAKRTTLPWALTRRILLSARRVCNKELCVSFLESPLFGHHERSLRSWRKKA